MIVRLKDQIQEIAAASDNTNRGTNTQELRIRHRETFFLIQSLRRAEHRARASTTDRENSAERPLITGSETSGHMGETPPPMQTPPLVMDIDVKEATQQDSLGTHQAVGGMAGMEHTGARRRTTLGSLRPAPLRATPILAFPSDAAAYNRRSPPDAKARGPQGK